MIWAGVHFLHILWIESNDTSEQLLNIQLLKAFLEIDNRACFMTELSSGVNQITEKNYNCYAWEATTFCIAGHFPGKPGLAKTKSVSSSCAIQLFTYSRHTAAVKRYIFEPPSARNLCSIPYATMFQKGYHPPCMTSFMNGHLVNKKRRNIFFYKDIFS